MDGPKRTVLFGQHKKLGARMTQFGGFEMPVRYEGIIEEHRAVRSTAGIFDLSHMGEFYLSGSRALALLERALTNSAARLREGQAQYTILCAEDGGTIDDLIVYRLGPEHFMLCVNASNIDTDREWLTMLNRDRAEFRDASEETALVAIQGPRSIGLLAQLASFAIDEVPRFGVAQGEVAGCACIAARTGYTGEDGFELFLAPDSAGHLFDAIIDAGSKIGLKPCGLGARDTLRLEAGLALYGHELDRSTTPLEAGLSRYVKFDRGFVGEPALSAERANGLKKRLIGLMTDDARTIARQGYRVFAGALAAGAITSGSFAPSLERPIAMGYVAPGLAHAASEKLQIEVRNRQVPASVTAIPFYHRRGNHTAGDLS